MMDKKLKANMTSRDHWLRFLFMILFAVILYAASVVVFVVVLLQFVFALLTGNDNANLREFGASLSSYIYQCLQFLTYASDDKPFPLGEWPEGEFVSREASEVSEPVVSEEQQESREGTEVEDSQDGDVIDEKKLNDQA